MTSKRPQRVRYPWEDWFSRKKITLIRGKHFFCQPHSMAQQIRNEARLYWVSISIEINDDTVTATITQEEPDE